MTATAEIERRMSVAEFLEWNEGREERWELVDGYPVEMMAGGKHRHNIATNNLSYALTGPSRARGCETTTSDTAVSTGEESIRYPDVVVNCAEDDLDGHIATSPTVLVEVLSPGTEWFDQNDKLDEYLALPSVREILLVSPTKVRVEIHSRPDEATDWSVERIEDLDASIELRSIGATLTMKDVYRGLQPRPARRIELVQEATNGSPSP